MATVLGILLLIAALANLWFLIKTLIIMSRNHILWAIGGFFFTPIVQIVYYFTEGKMLNPQDKQSFIYYFITFAVIFVLAIGFAIMLPSMLANVQ